MKKIVITILFVIMGCFAFAQNDGFFGNWSEGSSDRTSGGISAVTPGMPGTEIGDTNNASAPLGTGLIILTALGAGYTISKRCRQK